MLAHCRQLVCCAPSAACPCFGTHAIIHQCSGERFYFFERIVSGRLPVHFRSFCSTQAHLFTHDAPQGSAAGPSQFMHTELKQSLYTHCFTICIPAPAFACPRTSEFGLSVDTPSRRKPPPPPVIRSQRAAVAARPREMRSQVSRHQFFAVCATSHPCIASFSRLVHVREAPQRCSF